MTHILYDFGSGRSNPDTFPTKALQDAAVRVIATARASRFGRGPALVDVEVAETLLGLHPDAPAGAVSGEARATRLRGIAHDAAGLRRLVAAIDPELLDATLPEVRDRVSRGEGPFPA